MDLQDMDPKRSVDPLQQLIAQDLDPLSVADLDARIAALEGEIARAKAKRDGAVAFRSVAAGLFKR